MILLARSICLIVFLVLLSTDALAKTFIVSIKQANTTDTPQEVSCDESNRSCHLDITVLTEQQEPKPISINIRSVPGEVYFRFKSSVGLLHVNSEDYFSIALGNSLRAKQNVTLFYPPQSNEPGQFRSPVLKYTDEPVADLEISIRPSS